MQPFSPAQPVPAVSVLMPVHNGGDYLAAALDSILDQAGIAFEVICVDDGSTDGSWSTILRYAASHPVLRPVRSDGRGISDALNCAARLARGRLLARMDADDITFPQRLATQVRHLEARPDIVVLGTQALVIDAGGTVRSRLRVPVGTARVHAILELSSPLIHPTVIMRADAFHAAGGYRRSFDGAEDYDLWLRMAMHGRLDNMTLPLHCYRRHAGQQTVRAPFRQARLAALAYVCSRMAPDFAGAAPASATPTALPPMPCRPDPAMKAQLRYLTCAHLVNNGGTLSRTGASYLDAVICFALARREQRQRRRLALASFRHRLQLLRNGRFGEALATLPIDLARWRMALFGAALRHVRGLWYCRGGWRAEPERRHPVLVTNSARRRADLSRIVVATDG